MTIRERAGVVEEAIRNWEAERSRMIAEVENIPEEHFDYAPGEGARTIRVRSRAGELLLEPLG